jgi:hypothetical protein
MDRCGLCYRGRRVYDTGNLIAVHTRQTGNALVSPLAARRLFSLNLRTLMFLMIFADRAVGCRTPEGSYTMVSVEICLFGDSWGCVNFAPAHLGGP